jgi:hypothetical protein
MSFKSNLVDRIHPLEAFRKEAAHAINITDGLTDDDLNIIIIYLARDRRQIVVDREASSLRTSLEQG